MRARLQRCYRFEAAHFLPKVPTGHKCARMHGHSYLIEIAIEGELDPKRGWVLDFADIDEQATPLMRALDHQVLNEIEGLDNPTSELLAAWLWQRLHSALPGLVEVVVSETPTSRCTLSVAASPRPARSRSKSAATRRARGA
jgi:6-pyruvoyltetrahydropterin/6-carboxytetrahydropterin synthase